MDTTDTNTELPVAFLIVEARDDEEVDACIRELAECYHLQVVARLPDRAHHTESGVPFLSCAGIAGLWWLIKCVARIQWNKPDCVVLVKSANERRDRPAERMRNLASLLNVGIPLFTYSTGSFSLLLHEKVTRSYLPLFFLATAAASLTTLLCHTFGWAGALLGVALCAAARALLSAVGPTASDMGAIDGSVARPEILRVPPRYRRPAPLYDFRDADLGWTHSASVDYSSGFVHARTGRRHVFTIRTDPYGRRFTSDLPPYNTGGGPVVAFLGCSYTFGAFLDDRDTYPWLLQRRLPEYTVKNYGCCGYSLHQIYLMSERILSKGGVSLLVLGLHGDLGRRLAWSPTEIRAHFCSGRRFPSCKISGHRLVAYPPTGHVRVPLSGRDPFLGLMERGLNFLHRARLCRPDRLLDTNQQLLRNIRDRCRANGAHFLVACLGPCEDYYDFLFREGFQWTHAAVPLAGEQGREWTLYPFDAHPNGEAHHFWADSLEAPIRSALCGSLVRPAASDLDLRSVPNETNGPQVYPLF